MFYAINSNQVLWTDSIGTDGTDNTISVKSLDPYDRFYAINSTQVLWSDSIGADGTDNIISVKMYTKFIIVKTHIKKWLLFKVPCVLEDHHNKIYYSILFWDPPKE